MAMTLYEALSQFFQQSYNSAQAIMIVKNVEAKVLATGPTGYQDYYPPEYGGLLALEANVRGIQIHQHYHQQWDQFFQEHTTLFYSGQGRFSAINNWDVYKQFFDQEEHMISALQKLAALSYQAWSLIKDSPSDHGHFTKNKEQFFSYLMEEGDIRQHMFPKLRTPAMNDFLQSLRSKYPHLEKSIGLKVCGAGGGGCFLLIHPPQLKEKVQHLASSETSFTLLDHRLCPPKMDSSV
jgi:D-glycero-alpha-D-manno-heptose-7-phosphate kinase